MATCQKMCACSDDLDHARAHQGSAAAAINKAVDCDSEMLSHLPFFTDLAPEGSSQRKQTLDSCVFEDNEMIASVMSMQDIVEIILFKERLRAWVKSCGKFGNMNDDNVYHQTLLFLF